MSNQFNIKGAHFNMYTELIYNSEKGFFETKNKVVARNATTFLFSESDQIIEINNSSKIKYSSIAEALSLKVTVVEMNFSDWIIEDQGNEIRYEIDWPQILKKTKIDRVLLQYYPVIASSYTENKYSEKIVYEILNLINYRFKKADLLVFTGEMVWSGWLNHNLISTIINKFLYKSQYLAIDKEGIWQALKYSKENTPIRRINKKCLRANAFCYLPEKKGSVIKIQKEDIHRDLMYRDLLSPVVKLLHGWSIENTDIVLTDYLYIINPINKTTLFEDFDIKYEIVGYLPKSNMHEIEINNDRYDVKLKRGDGFNIGDNIGNYMIRKCDYYDIANHKLGVEILVSDGQVVQKGESLMKESNPFGVKIRARHDGVVDLGQLENGIIIVRYDLHQERMLIFGQGKVLKKFKNKIVFEIRAKKYIPDIVVGKEVIISSFTENEYLKILSVNNVNDIKYSLPELINQGYGLILIDTDSLQNVEQLILRGYKYLGDIAIVVMKLVSVSQNAYPKMINLNYQQTLLLSDNILYISNLDNHLSLNSNKFALSISYESGIGYYNIVRLLERKSILSSIDKELIIETDFANLIIYRS